MNQDVLIAVSFLIEIGDFRKFIKAGNSHLRKLLVEASWHYTAYRPGSKRLNERKKGMSREITAYAER